MLMASDDGCGDFSTTKFRFTFSFDHNNYYGFDAKPLTFFEVDLKIPEFLKDSNDAHAFTMMEIHKFSVRTGSGGTTFLFQLKETIGVFAKCAAVEGFFIKISE